MARPRSDRAHEQVLKAAGRLFAEQGIDATSMDAIAEAAGVSKATIYKHWPDKGALCLEVIGSLRGEQPPPESDDVEADILELLERQPSGMPSQLRLRIMPHLMAYAVRHPEIGAVWRSRVMDPRRGELLELLKRAAAEKRLAPDLDVEAASIALIGAMVYRNVLRLTGADPPKDLSRRILASWRPAATGTRRSVRKR